MDGDLSQDENGNFSVEINGRMYPIASVKFAVLKEGYAGPNGFTESAYPGSIPTSVGDVGVIIDAPSAESIGKRFLNMVYDLIQRS